MNNKLSTLITTAILSGLLAHSTAGAEEAGKTSDSANKAMAEKNSCKGKNSCAGKNGCAGKNEEEDDKNSCKGKVKKKKSAAKNSCKNGCAQKEESETTGEQKKDK